MTNYQLYARILRLLTDWHDYCDVVGRLPALERAEWEVIFPDTGLVWC